MRQPFDQRDDAQVVLLAAGGLRLHADVRHCQRNQGNEQREQVPMRTLHDE